MTRAQHWNTSDGLDTLIISTATVDTGKTYVLGKQYRNESQNNEDPFLLPVWQEGRDTLGTQHTFADTLAYDGWGELLSWYDLRDGATTHSESYAYDRTQNLTLLGATRDSVDTLTDRLVKRVSGTDTLWYSYDTNGSLIKTVHRPGAGAKDSTTYWYDALGQLRGVYHNGTKIVFYGYDVLGRRIAKRVYSSATGGTVAFTRYVYHGSQVNFETDSSGNVGYQYTWGTAGVDDIVAVDSGSNHYYTVTDKLGSVRGLVKKDGTWQWGTQYTPYGVVFEHDSVAGATPRLPIAWTGARLDVETGFYCLRNRYYDPAAGRFTQEDPVGYSGGGNVYSYGGGSPLAGRDPAGTRMEEEMYEPCHHCSDLDAINASDGLDMWGGVEQLRAYDDLAWLSYSEYQSRYQTNIQAFRPVLNSFSSGAVDGNGVMISQYDVNGRALNADEFADAKAELLTAMEDLNVSSDGFSLGAAALSSITTAFEQGRVGWAPYFVDHVSHGSYRAMTIGYGSDAVGKHPQMTFLGTDLGLVTLVHEGYHWTRPYPSDVGSGSYFDAQAESFLTRIGVPKVFW